jgi:uncharacterized membrane protein YfcA
LPDRPLDSWIEVALAALGTGLVAGTISGLLGVGGGIVIVPVLEAVLGFLGVDPSVRMPIAVATSLATIVPTSIASARAHHRRGAVDLEIARLWLPAVAAGALAGSLLASRAPAHLLTGLFGVVAALAAAKMLLPLDGKVLSPSVPRGPLGRTLPAGIGLVSSMMGIGGGTLSVPVLTLCSQPVHRAVGTANLLGLVIAIPGTIGYLLARPAVPVPPGTVGLVNLTGFALIAVATVIAAPWGARIAHSLDRRRLSAAFGVFLAIVAARMLYRTFA